MGIGRINSILVVYIYTEYACKGYYTHFVYAV